MTWRGNSTLGTCPSDVVRAVRKEMPHFRLQGGGRRARSQKLGVPSVVESSAPDTEALPAQHCPTDVPCRTLHAVHLRHCRISIATRP